MRVDLAGGPARVFVPVTVEPVDRAVGVRHPHQLRNRIRQRVELAFAGPQRGLGALALGDLLGSDIDADDLTVGVAMRMPVGDPEALIGLVGALAGHLDAGDGIAGTHDRLHDAFDRVRQRRYAIPHIAAKMILNRYAADIGQALVDLEVAAVRRQERKADRRSVVDQLQRRLPRIEHLV